MGDVPVVSVIINCFNSAAYLREAIDSVYRQTFSDWEIVFFDNNSTDSSASIALSYDDRVQYFKNDKTVLLGEARNLAIEKARGEFIAFLDCDDVWLPEKLSLQLKQFRKPSTRPVGFCYTDAMRVDSQGNHLLSYSHEKDLFGGNIYRELIYSSFIACSACIIRKDVFDKVGLFNPELHYVEEWDLWLRIAKYYDLAFVDSKLTEIRVHDSNVSRDIEGQYSEKVKLAEMIIDRDPAMKSECQRSMNMSAVQYQLTKLLLARNSELFSQLLVMIGTVLAKPAATIAIARKMINPKIYKAFRKKYLSSESSVVHGNKV